MNLIFSLLFRLDIFSPQRLEIREKNWFWKTYWLSKCIIHSSDFEATLVQGMTSIISWNTEKPVSSLRCWISSFHWLIHQGINSHWLAVKTHRNKIWPLKCLKGAKDIKRYRWRDWIFPYGCTGHTASFFVNPNPGAMVCGTLGLCF